MVPNLRRVLRGIIHVEEYLVVKYFVTINGNKIFWIIIRLIRDDMCCDNLRLITCRARYGVSAFICKNYYRDAY